MDKKIIMRTEPRYGDTLPMKFDDENVEK